MNCYKLISFREIKNPRTSSTGDLFLDADFSGFRIIYFFLTEKQNYLLGIVKISSILPSKK
jgi:hypothetical protein